jgi:hypothetical protein
MKTNMGLLDRRIRLVLGILIVAAGIYFKTWWGVVGVVFLATSLISWCPLYFLFSLSTQKKKS